MVDYGCTEVIDHFGGEIDIRNISKVYKDADNNEILALDNVSLKIKAGEFVSIIGSSGCGKSTLLKLLAGLEKPTEGEIYVNSSKIDGPHYERGLVFQDPTLFPWMNVKNNVASGLAARGILKEKVNEVDEYIQLVGLDGFQKSYPHQLSGGMAQRVALARALINHPKVLLLDEPLGALDAFIRMQMQDEILRIWKARRATILLVTHDIDEAIHMSDRIVIMTSRPGSVQRIIDIDLERPRDRNNVKLFDMRTKILEFFHFAT